MKLRQSEIARGHDIRCQHISEKQHRFIIVEWLGLFFDVLDFFESPGAFSCKTCLFHINLLFKRHSSLHAWANCSKVTYLTFTVIRNYRKSGQSIHFFYKMDLPLVFNSQLYFDCGNYCKRYHC